MRKVLLFIVCILLLTTGRANDTLTRREIYNFNVGDTFVYHHYGNDQNHQPPITYNYYSAQVVQGKYFSPDSQVVMYNWINPYTLNSWGSTHTDLDLFEILMHCHIDTAFGDPYVFDSLNGTDVTTNSVSTCDANRYVYALGLGEIEWYFAYYNLGQTEYNTRLVFFSKDTIRWGYYPLNLAINEPDPVNLFFLSPNPAADNVTISIDETMLGSTATIYDITGRNVAVVSLTTDHNLLSTQSFPGGVYFVAIMNKEGRITAKKLIVRK